MPFLSWLIRRWWFWGLVPVALVLLTALSIRWAGQAAWQREQAAARAAGAPTSFAELVALAPPVDVARQERLWDLQRRVDGAEWVQKVVMLYRPLEAAWLGDTAPDSTLTPEERAACHTGSAEVAAEFAAICTSGQVLVGSAGWLREDCPTPAALTLYDFLRLRSLSSGVMKVIGSAGIEQVMAGSAAVALQRLDDLFAASAPIITLQDAITHLHVARFRDAMYLKALALGALAPERGAAWLREPATGAVDYSRGLLALRATMLAALGDGQYDTPMWWAGDFTWSSRAATVLKATTQLNDAVFLAQRVTRWSRRYRALAAALSATADTGAALAVREQWLSDPLLGDLDTWTENHAREDLSIMPSFIRQPGGYARNALMGDNRHRMVRAAARAISAWRSGMLPADHSAAETILGADLHASTQFLPPLIYERLSPTRFRLGIDPLGPLPAFTTRDRLKDVRRIGSPPATATVEDLAWSLELDCAGLPRASDAGVPATEPPATAP